MWSLSGQGIILGMHDDNELLQEVGKLRGRLDGKELPPAMSDKLDEMLLRLERSARYGTYSQEYERVSHYVDWVANLPWVARTQDRIDINQARSIMDKHHYGLEAVKQRILEHLAIIKLNLDQGRDDIITRAPVLCLVGLAGTGKTTFAYALAEAMGRQIARIPFGGMGSARDLRGQSRLHLEAEPGHIIKALRSTGTRNPVFLLDEIDRVSDEARADVMGVLLELLDPGQNKAFHDHYMDYPFNLNEVFFIATSNNIDNLSTAVVNRLEIIQMPTYSDQDKIIIAKSYLMPHTLTEAGLSPDAVVVPEEMWPKIVRPLGFDSGIRVLKRTIETLARKVAYKAVSGQTGQVVISDANLSEYVEQYY